VDGAAVTGEADARVTVIEFSDYQCPFCRRFAGGTLGRLIKDYRDVAGIFGFHAWKKSAGAAYDDGAG
jgi:protein-disulfide isomerase